MKYEKGKIRKWINRDDGRWHRVGNYDLTGIEIAGCVLMLSCFVGLALAQHTLNQKNKYVSIGLGIIGLVVYIWGSYKNDKARKDEEEN
ncbi:MAG: hypothetical protein EPN25_03780 [Nitrospirae bacterium]|nr:MAG: hypothetical protein EPN25_03780 [Nitrospirota bacterium]